MRISRRARIPWLLSLLCLAQVSAVTAQTLLEASTGEIDGRRALAIYPVEFDGRTATELLDLEQCEAHLKSRTTFETFIRPCGEWFLVPPDSYAYWTERPWQISPYTRKLFFADEPFRGRGLQGAAPLGPAGRIAWPDAVPGLELRLIHAAPPVVDGLLQGALSRRVPTASAREGVRMPVGPTLAAVWNSGDARYVELSRPFEVSRGATVTPTFEWPSAESAHLVVQVVRHESCVEVREDSLEIRLEHGAETISPDVLVAQQDSAHALYFHLPPGPARVHARALGGEMDAIAVRLVAGSIGQAVGHMRARPPGPSLDVEVSLPHELSAEPPTIEVRQLPSKTVVTTRQLDQGVWRTTFEGLGPGTFEVAMPTVLGKVSSIVELRDGEDGFARLVLDPIVISGRVFLGEEPQPATLTFTTSKRRSVQARAGEEGHYELVTIEPLISVSIDLQTAHRPPFVEFFPRWIESSAQRDFTISDLRFEVLVVDARSGLPVTDARIVSRNRYLLEDDVGHGGEAPDMAVMQTAQTGEDGVALLPPLRPGTLEVTASAEGYARMPGPTTADVLADIPEQRLEIRLEPIGEMLRVQIRVPPGHHAGDAELALSNVAGDILFEARADSAGRLEMPRHLAASAVLMRHPQLAFALEPWSPPSSGEVEWRLQPAAPPLTLRVVDPANEPMPNARIGLWLGGRLIAGRALYWLSQRRPMADAAGYFTVAGLPLLGAAAVAWPAGSDEARAIAGLPAQATTLTPPWPGIVELQAIGR